MPKKCFAFQIKEYLVLDDKLYQVLVDGFSQVFQLDALILSEVKLSFGKLVLYGFNIVLVR